MNEKERETVRALKAEITRLDGEICRLAGADINWHVVAQTLQKRADGALKRSDEFEDPGMKIMEMTSAQVMNAFAHALLMGLLKEEAK